MCDDEGISMTHAHASLTEQEPLVTGNAFDKYRSTNPVHQFLVGRFLFHARALIRSAAPSTILEIGCGNGDFAARVINADVVPPQRPSYVGIDVCSKQVEDAALRYPKLAFQTASAYSLPFDCDSFDLVLACEVLEHLQNPTAAVVEARRVSRAHILVSVPWEPCWRVLNVLRGKYLFRLGNTPGHVQHFSRRAIRRVITPYFRVVEERHPFPWTMILACCNGDVSSCDDP
jgi:ubiquinone/menaquinone biosynthesis C-methylase UbiE